MASSKKKTIPVETGPVTTVICTSVANFNFPNIRKRSKLVSEDIHVPEINAKWHMEAVPIEGSATFSATVSPPEIKIIIEVNDQSIVNSKIYRANINMFENTEKSKKNYMYFYDYIQPIDKNRIVIDTLSTEYDRSASRKLSHNVYFQDIYRHDNGHSASKYAGYDYDYSYSGYTTYVNWGTKESFIFDCTITFDVLGKFTGPSSHAMRALLPTLKSSHLETFASLVNDDTFADFTFIVRNKQFKIHKCILGAASEVLMAMFTCGLDETKNGSAKIDCDPEIFEYFIKFIYTGTWPEEKMPTVSFELYELANLYGVETLKKVCLAYITSLKVDSNNALDIYEFAITYEDEKLLESTWEYIRVNMLDIKEPCHPKSMKHIRAVLEQKRMYDEVKRSFIDKDTTIIEPVKKKSRSTKK